VGDYKSNVTCHEIDPSNLVCNSVLSIDTIRKDTVVRSWNDWDGKWDCKDTTIVVRIDSIYSWTCWKDCGPGCDTTKRSGDTTIFYYEDSVVYHYDTLYIIGSKDSAAFCPPLHPDMPDTLHIILEGTTKSGCDFVDSFLLMPLSVPREHIGDTFVLVGDTLGLYAYALKPNTVQWWEEMSGVYNFG